MIIRLFIDETADRWVAPCGCSFAVEDDMLTGETLLSAQYEYTVVSGITWFPCEGHASVTKMIPDVRSRGDETT